MVLVVDWNVCLVYGQNHRVDAEGPCCGGQRGRDWYRVRFYRVPISFSSGTICSTYLIICACMMHGMGRGGEWLRRYHHRLSVAEAANFVQKLPAGVRESALHTQRERRGGGQSREKYSRS
jgi:hypothetical protein